jgi:Transposase family tnp2
VYHNTNYCIKLDDLYGPAAPADVDADFDAHMASGSTTVDGSDVDWPGMDPNISDTEADQQHTDSDSDSEEDFDSDGSDDQSDDSDVDHSSSTLHPSLVPLSKGHQTTFDHGTLPDSDDTFQVAADATILPAVVQKLREQLLSGYTCPAFPPISDSRGRPLASDEILSLKHYIAWVNSHGTVEAYNCHAKVLQETTGIEILSLYMVRKLAVEVTGMLSQLVDMCPRSCMAFTGEYKDLQFCIYTRDKRHGPCGQLRYNKKGEPRAQMLYTPIAPIIQSFYKNEEMAKAMRYRHEHLQEALNKSDSNDLPTKYSDFSDSINHVNHFHYLNLFQQETDTAITISGDGAQLTMKKQSDVWVLVVTIINLPPNMRSKAANIIIPLVIPGPLSPGNVESFVYVLYEELARLGVGVWTWDAHLKKYFLLKVYLCGVLGDMLGSAKLSRMAGHMALYGCRFCTVRGARASGERGMIYYFL